MEKKKKENQTQTGRWLENCLKEHALRKVCNCMNILEVRIQLARSLCVVVRNVLHPGSRKKTRKVMEEEETNSLQEPGRRGRHTWLSATQHHLPRVHPALRGQQRQVPRCAPGSQLGTCTSPPEMTFPLQTICTELRGFEAQAMKATQTYTL